MILLGKAAKGLVMTQDRQQIARQQIKSRLLCLALLLATVSSSASYALSIDLAGLTHRQFALDDSPLFLGSQADANVLLLMDDSISMSSSFTLDHDADNDGNIDKTGAGGARNGGADQAQGMARGTDDGRLIYPWLFPAPPGFNEVDGTCRGIADVSTANVSALRLPDEEASPFCSQMPPSKDLLDALTNNDWVRTDAGIASPPDVAGDLVDVWKLRSATYNPLYYNPSRTYSPWPGVDSAGVAFTEANPAAARLDPYDSASATIDLTSSYQFDSVIRLQDGSYDTVNHAVYSQTVCTLFIIVCLNFETTTFDTQYKPAVYYQADGTEVDLSGLSTSSTEFVNFANWFQYYRNRDLVAKGMAATLVESAEDIRVAFATIHQNDAIAVPAVAVESTDAANEGSKKTLLDGIYSMQPMATGTPLRRALDDAGNYFRCEGDGRSADYYASSPVAESQNVVGDSSCPVLTEAEGGECQVHNTVLVTDGYSSLHGLPLTHTGYPAETGSAGDARLSDNSIEGNTDHDSDEDTVSDGEPYADGEAGTLADAAMDAYEHDLQSGFDGTQRMYTHALVVSAEPGSGDADAILAGTGNWPTPLFALPASTPYEPAVADAFEYAALLTELKHATANGRGEYISGLSSGAASQLLGALNEMGGSGLSGTNTTASSTQLGDETLIFTTSYNFKNWSGNLVAYTLEDDGSLSEQWDAASQLTGESGRVILTYDPRRGTAVSTGYGSGGVAFTPDVLEDLKFFGALPLVGGLGPDLDSALGSLLGLDFLGGIVGGVLGDLLGGILDPIIDAILTPVLNLLTALGLDGVLDILGISNGLDAETIEYVRGDRSNEQQNGGGLRNRVGTVLGPILSSNPVYVGVPDFDYPVEFENLDLVQSESYRQFALDNADRVPMVYVGGNDGMLHGFEAATGVERIAYVPARVLSNLAEYDEPSFDPQAYVDGQISVVDVYGRYPGCGTGSCWRTILVGSLGRGGQGIYALDVTEPGSYDGAGAYQAGAFSEANAAELVLWEFTDAGSINDAVNDLIQDALCDALLGLCDEATSGIGALVEDFIGASIVEPLLDDLIQIDEQRGHAGMGYTILQPNIVHTSANFGNSPVGDESGDWGVVISNGYNNTEIDLGIQDIDTSVAFDSLLSVSLTGNAYAYVIDLETGLLVRDFDTEVGAFLDLGQVVFGGGTPTITLPDLTDNASSLLMSITLPTSVPNGMATTAVVDVDVDRTVDYVYGGDLVGNLWKIDLTDTDEANWNFHANNLGTPVALFQATNFSSVPQPITTEPIVMLHPQFPTQEGQLVLFGTGELLEADSVGEQHFTQSIYGVWDKNDGAALNTSDKTKYLRRFIIDSVSVDIDTDLDGSQESATVRLVSDDTYDADSSGGADGPIDWSSQLGWYLDLAEGASASAVSAADNQGERVVADPVLRNQRLLISTTIVDEAICNPAISNWLFELDARDGSPTVLPPFDLNGDGGVTAADVYTDGDDNTFTPAGRFSDGTYNPVPTILLTNTGHEIHLTSGAGGDIERTVVNPIGYERSRSTWRQLR